MLYGVLVFFGVYIASSAFELVSKITFPEGYQMGFSIIAGGIVAAIYYISKRDDIKR